MLACCRAPNPRRKRRPRIASSRWRPNWPCASCPKSLREAFSLRFWHDMNYEEIAVIQGVSAGLVRWRYFAARRRLHENTRRLGPEPASSKGGSTCEMKTVPKGGSPARQGSTSGCGWLAGPPIPVDLLSRCLATIDPLAQTKTRPFTSRLWSRPRFAAAIASVSNPWLRRVPGPPSKCHRGGFLAGRAINLDRSSRLPPRGYDEGSRTAPARLKPGTCAVKAEGARSASGDGLVGVVVNNGRWEFRWDVPGHLVAAWSTALLGKQSEFEHAGLIQNNEALLQWAETHKADIHIEPDTLNGHQVRKVTLRWPGPGSPGSQPQVDTVWFNPDSLLPLRQRSENWDGMTSDATYDYPAPENVPADLLQFQPPSNVTMEINDPDLGRQVYSEPRAAQNDLTDKPSKGADQ